jgi:exonuclease III
MKIVSLNTWGGRAGRKGLMKFFDNYKDEIDIFCLQEIWSAPYENFNGHPAGGKKIDHEEIMIYGMQDISEVLSGHSGFFRPHFLENYGLFMLAKNNLPIKAEGELFVFKEKGHVPSGDIGTHARNIQYVTTELNGRSLTVINFHGLWNGKGKTDSEDRIEQSKKILEFTSTLEGDYVLCGDFNLLPDTQSIKLFEDTGLRNLIKEYGITSTRTSHYTKEEKFADYIFVTPDIQVKEFKVLPDEISDHAPLLLEIE